MINEQTALVLRSFRTQLQVAVDTAAHTLIEQVPEIERYTHTEIRHRYKELGSHGYGLLGTCVHPDCQYTETVADGGIVAFDPLYTLLEQLDADIAMVQGGARDA